MPGDQNSSVDAHIAALQAANNRLEVLNQRFEVAWEAARAALYEHRVPPDASTYRSEHWADILGYDRDELPAAPVFLDWLQQQVHPDDRSRLSRSYRAFIAGRREDYAVEVRIRHKQGHWIWARGICKALHRDEQGRVRRVVGVMLDITDRKQVEASLREADQRKDEYLAMLGHELRNPLAALRSATELLKLAPTVDPRLQRAHGVIDRQSAHMTRLVDGLLEVSRIVRGKIDLDRETIDLRTILQGVLADRDTELDDRGLEVAEAFSDEPVWVMGDGVRLAQVFDNIIGNAAKFTEGPGRITIRVTEDEGDAVVVVRDTGIGIRPDILRTMFEPFQQDTQDVSRARGGLGLGLALAKELVVLHGGTIEAHSAGAGKGAELRVRLPLTSPPRDAVREREGNASTRRILLVEDNLDAAEMLRTLLQLQGHEVTVVDTGQQALDFLDDNETDVVLCDIGLPAMSGYDVARAVRSKPGLRALPLVAVTGYGQPEDRERSMQAGFDEHVTKPVELSTINDVLDRVSHGRHLRH